MKKTQPNLKNNEDDPSSTDENQSSTHKRKRLSLDSPAITTSFKFQEPNVSRVLADVSNVTPTTPSLSSDQLFTIPESVFTHVMAMLFVVCQIYLIVSLYSSYFFFLNSCFLKAKSDFHKNTTIPRSNY